MLFQRKASTNQSLAARGWIGRLGVPALLLGALAIAGSGAAIALDGDVLYEPNGLGVEGATDAGPVQEQINHQAGTEDSEALAIDFGAEALLAEVYISNLLSRENSCCRERGRWEAFDGIGQRVGEEEFEFTSSSEGLITIEVGTNTLTPFRYLVFTALPYSGTSASDGDSSDYFVRYITYTLDEFGAVPQLIGGQGSNLEDWIPLSPIGFALGVSYLDDEDNFIGAEPVVVNTEECTGGTGEDNGGCIVPLTDELTLVVENASDVNGSFTAAAQTIIDPRASCDNTLTGDTQVTLNLGFNLGDGEFGPVIPAHLCGTPNDLYQGQPTFQLVNINSQLTVITSVLELIAANEDGDVYNCFADDKSKRPVVGWLPKTSNPEIPVLDANNELVTELQDVTFACGSSRGGSSRFSFLAYDLRHIENAPYVDIIGTAVAQLDTTIAQTDFCIDKITNKAVLSRSSAGSNAFNSGRYSTAKRQYLKLLQTVSNDIPYQNCLFNLEGRTVFVGDPLAPDEGNLPRNFRGDLIVQVQHILYMIDRMLDETKPALPAF